MANNQIGIDSAGNKRNYQGLSTDTKPVTCGSGSTYLELDTMEEFIFDSVNISAETATGWWRA